MVKFLHSIIKHKSGEQKSEIEVSQIPHSEGTLRIAVDSKAFGFYILTNGGRERDYNYGLGGDYSLYRKRIEKFFDMFSKLSCDLEFTFIFSCSRSSQQISPLHEAVKEKKITKEVTIMNEFMEKAKHKFNTSYEEKEIIPAMMSSEIKYVLRRIQEKGKIKVNIVKTQNLVQQYAAKLVNDGKCDVVFAQDTDITIFHRVYYVPLETIHKNEYNELVCQLYDSEIVSNIIGLNSEERLIDLSILLGNDLTEDIIARHNIYRFFGYSNISPLKNAMNIIKFLNENPNFDIKDNVELELLYDQEKNFETAVKESYMFYEFLDIKKDDESGKAAEIFSHNLPNILYSLIEGNEFWFKIRADNFKDDIKTVDVTRPFRKIIYGIFECDKVKEYIPRDTKIVTEVVEKEPAPTFNRICKMKTEKKKEALYRIIHMHLPEEIQPDYKKDPLLKFPPLFLTIGYTLRYLISLKYTEIGKPAISLNELKALINHVICINFLDASDFQSEKRYKPWEREIHISGLYQQTFNHISWLQNIFGLEYRHHPHRVFDGSIFAAALKSWGELDEKFISLWSCPEVVLKYDKKREELLQAILYPFPKDILDNVIFMSEEKIKEPQTIEEKADPYDNPYGLLLEGSNEPILVHTPPPPSPEATAKEQKPKKEVMDEDEEMEFLKNQAEKNGSGKREIKTLVKKPQKPHTPYHRVEKVDLNQSNQYTKTDSKANAKLQINQQGHDSGN